MGIKEHIIGAVDVTRVPELIEAHFARPPYFEYRVRDFVPVATFAVSYFFDAVQDIVNRAMLSGEEIDIQLPSGWRAKKVDIGHLWKRHISFTSPSDPEVGFVLQGLLDMVESEVPEDDSASIDDMTSRMVSSFKIEEDLVDNNQSSKRYHPENSTEIDDLTACRFGKPGGWEAETSNSLYRDLLKGRNVHETFEYRPQRAFSDRPLGTNGGGRSITEPGEALDILRVVSDFVLAYDPEAFAECMRRHANTRYMTLVADYVPLLEATRGAMSHGASFPAAPFSEMIDEMWRRAACEDVMRNLEYVTETADSLIDMGHTTREDVFVCNDGRTRAYASTDGDTLSVYCEWEDWSTLIRVRNDRIAVYKCDFDTGAVGETVVDFSIEDGTAMEINDICAYEDLTAGVMKRSLFDLSSVHSYVVHNRARSSATMSPSS